METETRLACICAVYVQRNNKMKANMNLIFLPEWIRRVHGSAFKLLSLLWLVCYFLQNLQLLFFCFQPIVILFSLHFLFLVLFLYLFILLIFWNLLVCHQKISLAPYNSNGGFCLSDIVETYWRFKQYFISNFKIRGHERGLSLILLLYSGFTLGKRIFPWNVHHLCVINRSIFLFNWVNLNSIKFT